MNITVYGPRHSQMNSIHLGVAPLQFSGNNGGSGSPPVTSAVAIVVTLPIFIVIQH